MRIKFGTYSNSIIPITGIVLIMAILSGCSMTGDIKKTELQTPSAWNSLSSKEEKDLSRLETKTANLREWWKEFKDPKIDQLIQEAMQANFDVRTAAAKLRESRAIRGTIAPDRLPQVNSGGTVQRIESLQAIGAAPTRVTTNLFDAEFDASWELDIWGQTGKKITAADADTASAAENQRDVFISVAAETARTYIELRGFQKRLEIANANIRIQQEIYDLTKQLYSAEIINQLDISRAEAQLTLTQAQVPLLEQMVKQTLNRLTFMLGKADASAYNYLLEEAPLPTLPPRVPIGLPSDLLRRRPDIRRAEQDLIAANARVGVAVRDLFPRFSLTGSLGLKSNDIDEWGEMGSRFWSFGPNFSWPILDFGRIRSNIKVQEARQEKALISYEQAVANAFRNAEDALIAYGKEQIRNDSLTKSFKACQVAVDIAKRRYEEGVTDFLEVLDAGRTLYSTEDALSQSTEQMAVNLISLYKALGGGWDASQSQIADNTTKGK